MSGRRKVTVAQNARLFAQTSYIFEAGSCLVLDGEELWLTGDYQPQPDASIDEQIEASGAPKLLLKTYAGRLEYHDPGIAAARSPTSSADSSTRARSTSCSSAKATAGCGWSTTAACTGARPRSWGSKTSARTTSAARGVEGQRRRAAHARPDDRPEDAIAVGDSREDLETCAHVGAFWFVANAVERDPTCATSSPGAPTSTSPKTPTARGSTKRSSRRSPSAGVKPARRRDGAGRDCAPRRASRSPAPRAASASATAARSCAPARPSPPAAARPR